MTKRGVVGIWTHDFYDGWAPNYLFSSRTITIPSAASMRPSATAEQIPATHAAPGVPTANGTAQSSAAEGDVVRAQQYQHAAERAAVRHEQCRGQRPEISGQLLCEEQASRRKSPHRSPRGLGFPRRRSAPRRTGPLAEPAASAGHRSASDQNKKFVSGHNGDQGGTFRNRWQRPGQAKRERPQRRQKAGANRVPAGSYVIRMDQPYSRMADMMLDTQYYSSSDPRSYDDTGWTLGALRNVKTIRATDTAIGDGLVLLLAWFHYVLLRGWDRCSIPSSRSPHTSGGKAQPSTGSCRAARAHHSRGRCSPALSGWPSAPARSADHPDGPRDRCPRGAASDSRADARDTAPEGHHDPAMPRTVSRIPYRRRPLFRGLGSTRCEFAGGGDIDRLFEEIEASWLAYRIAAIRTASWPRSCLPR